MAWLCLPHGPRPKDPTGPAGQDRNLGDPPATHQQFPPALPPKPAPMCPPGLAQPSPPPPRPQREPLACAHAAPLESVFCAGAGLSLTTSTRPTLHPLPQASPWLLMAQQSLWALALQPLSHPQNAPSSPQPSGQAPLLPTPGVSPSGASWISPHVWRPKASSVLCTGLVALHNTTLASRWQLLSLRLFSLHPHAHPNRAPGTTEELAWAFLQEGSCPRFLAWELG